MLTDLPDEHASDMLGTCTPHKHDRHAHCNTVQVSSGRTLGHAPSNPEVAESEALVAKLTVL